MADTIYRQEAIDCEYQVKIINDIEYVMLSEVQMKMRKLSSAEPERKRSKWIRITQGATPEKYMCPFCHRTVEHEGVEYFVSMMYPFCHCGADMRGENIC